MKTTFLKIAIGPIMHVILSYIEMHSANNNVSSLYFIMNQLISFKYKCIKENQNNMHCYWYLDFRTSIVGLFTKKCTSTQLANNLNNLLITFFWE